MAFLDIFLSFFISFKSGNITDSFDRKGDFALHFQFRKRGQIGALLGIIFILTFTLFGIYQIQEKPIPVSAVLPKEPVTVIIDPGHGGIDGGATDNNIIEKDINLAVSQNLRDLLSIQGFRVIMTREDDRSLHDDGLTQIARQKRSDMYHRLSVIENNPNAVFISIHQNKFEQSSSKGAQIFYSPNHPDSQKLAQSIQDSFVSLLQPDNHREIKEAQNNLFLLYESQIPAVMVECGFISNPEEAAKLQTEVYQQQIAFTVYRGLHRYLQAADSR